jgi:PTS system glucitol/sorbitol-specific IIC component
MSDTTEQRKDKPALDSAIRVVKKILPVLKIIAPPLVLGLVLFVFLFWSGLGDVIGENLAERTGTVPALFIMFAVCFIPSLSPVLGPSVLVALAAAALCGEQIASGKVNFLLALTALLILDAQLGGSFIPPSLGLGENEPETMSAGVPAIVFTRLVTVSAAVALACLLLNLF